MEVSLVSRPRTLQLNDLRARNPIRTENALLNSLLKTGIISTGVRNLLPQNAELRGKIETAFSIDDLHSGTQRYRAITIQEEPLSELTREFNLMFLHPSGARKGLLMTQEEFVIIPGALVLTPAVADLPIAVTPITESQSPHSSTNTGGYITEGTITKRATHHGWVRLWEKAGRIEKFHDSRIRERDILTLKVSSGVVEIYKEEERLGQVNAQKGFPIRRITSLLGFLRQVKGSFSKEIPASGQILPLKECRSFPQYQKRMVTIEIEYGDVFLKIYQDGTPIEIANFSVSDEKLEAPKSSDPNVVWKMVGLGGRVNIGGLFIPFDKSLIGQWIGIKLDEGRIKAMSDIEGKPLGESDIKGTFIKDNEGHIIKLLTQGRIIPLNAIGSTTGFLEINRPTGRTIKPQRRTISLTRRAAKIFLVLEKGVIVGIKYCDRADNAPKDSFYEDVYPRIYKNGRLVYATMKNTTEICVPLLETAATVKITHKRLPTKRAHIYFKDKKLYFPSKHKGKWGIVVVEGATATLKVYENPTIDENTLPLYEKNYPLS
ncbi:hypothetical protein A2526_05550 [candidate division WOR-1 bacterium RIFOXYD2_FULL_36_8]|nr:MAG: hypothetical protein A2230_04150 [candidate division WOR-1 bacterium RIFOXYA2_FULL_36_21]OGC14418.1 MAG: hypothetical protein A2282_08220 [candidate division WOR-1 bacterium RIFOXYA12_FULL_36_13]OGC40515.1 MAG: hypothetical protein A2526_05550 [candidate division WOR-1 bacterium RIFOXYD2_FULL_36_8]